MTVFAWLLVLVLRSTVILLVALGLLWLMRRSSAASRHRLLTITAVSLLALPALPEVLPRLHVPFAPLPIVTAFPATAVVLGESSRSSPEPGAAHVAAPAAAPVTAPKPHGVAAPEAFGLAAVVAWLLGVVAALVGLGRALLRERRLLAGSRPLEGPWRDALDEARRTLAFARPVRLLTSDAIEAPLSAGWSRPAVLLPPSAEGWPEDARRMVVQHELVHLTRRDGLRRLAWRLAAALYWFHPLARIAERQARLVGEHACDEEVVRLGTRPSLYARRLLEIAEALRGRPVVFASALTMVERSQLERRVVMILGDSRATGRGRVVAVAGLAILGSTVLGVACAAPAPPQGATEPPPRAPAQDAAPVRTDEGTVEISIGPADFDGAMDEDHDVSFIHHFGDGLRLSARFYGPVVIDERSGAILTLPRGSSALIETRGLQGSSQRMLITEEQGTLRHEWWLDSDARPVDDDARAWLATALEVIAAYREMGEIQGYVGSLQGQIGSIQGQIGSLQGRIGAIQGEEGSLQGKIGSIHGERGSLMGEIGSHQGAIGSLQAARASAGDELRKLIDGEIQEHEAAIRELEAVLNTGELARRLAAAEAELRAFQKGSRGAIAELERQIAAIRGRNEIADLEQDIGDVHAEERIDAIELRVAPIVERLETLIRKLEG